MQKSKLIIFLLILFILPNLNLARGETLEFNFQPSLNLNPLESVNKAGIGGIGAGDVLDAFKLDAFKFDFPFDPGKININTNIPISPKANESRDVPVPNSNDINLKQFLTPKDISSDDLVGAVKAVITLVIEIFLVIISITAQILHVILGYLK